MDETGLALSESNFVELHQIKYFLALTKALNFTRAAEECNVSQPALSRAISQLEGELGAKLFRRERNLTHLTEFGKKVEPELRQCFDASLNAKSVARDFLKLGQAPLNIALSRSIEMDSLSTLLGELAVAYPKIEIRIVRGAPREIGERLKNGEAEIGITGPLGYDWERIDAKKLYEQEFGLLLNMDNPLYLRNEIKLADLNHQRFLSRPFCTISEILVARLRELGPQTISKHEVPSIDDLPGLVLADFGIGIWPMTRRYNNRLSIVKIHDFDMTRPIYVHTVFGRKLSSAASAFILLLRSRDWSETGTYERSQAEQHA